MPRGDPTATIGARAARAVTPARYLTPGTITITRRLGLGGLDAILSGVMSIDSPRLIG